MKTAKPKRIPFTVENVTKSLVSFTGISSDRLIVKKSAVKLGGYYVWISGMFDDSPLEIYSGEKALDDHTVWYLATQSHDSWNDFVTTGRSQWELLQAIAKGCRLSRLKPWIVAHGRENNYSEAEVKNSLKYPLKTLVKLCDGDNLDDQLAVLALQCNYSRQAMAAHLLPVLGGAKTYWSDVHYFVDTPESYIIQYGICDTENDAGWAKLLSCIELAKAAPQRKAAITKEIFEWLYKQLLSLRNEHGQPMAVLLKRFSPSPINPGSAAIFTLELKLDLMPKDVASILDNLATSALKDIDETSSSIVTYAVYVLFHRDSSYLPRKLFRVVGAEVAPTELHKFPKNNHG